ncbi:MAG: nucleotidyltransferase domain-containing protein [Cytophagales bacterium]|nr:nucleotidyltransferase domain-containing protein [Cytophagales bacterium]
MESQKTINTIKSTVSSFFPEAKVLLFGSRAREDSDNHSDYDVMVIINETLPLKEKRNWRGRINEALVEALHAPVDVLLNSEEEISIKKELPGHVVRWAIKEGVIL